MHYLRRVLSFFQMTLETELCLTSAYMERFTCGRDRMMTHDQIEGETHVRLPLSA